MFIFLNPFTAQYLEGDRAMLNCSNEHSETIQLSSVVYSYSTCSHGDTYGIQNLCDGHTACSFDVTNSKSEVHVGLLGRRHYKFRIIVNVSYIS